MFMDDTTTPEEVVVEGATEEAGEEVAEDAAAE